MECKKCSLKRGNIDHTKNYMNRNNPSIICVLFVFVLIFIESKVKCPAFLTQNAGYTDFHFSRGREFIHTKTGKSVGTLRLLRPTYHLFTIKPHDAINQSPGLRKDQTSPRQTEQPNISQFQNEMAWGLE